MQEARCKFTKRTISHNRNSKDCSINNNVAKNNKKQRPHIIKRVENMKITKFTTSIIALAVTAVFSAQAADGRFILKLCDQDTNNCSADVTVNF
jgi:ribosome maturation protein Sdo1